MAKPSSITRSKSSGGPQTEEGKKIASLNSLKTGAYSKLIVLPNERQEEFDQLAEQFQKGFYPKDAVEMMLVRKMAVITWKKLRLEKLEHDYCSRQLAAQITPEEFCSIEHRFTKRMYEFWLDVYGQAKPLATDEPSLEELVNTKVRQPDEPEKFLIPICIDKLLPHFEAGAAMR